MYLRVDGTLGAQLLTQHMPFRGAEEDLGLVGMARWVLLAWGGFLLVGFEAVGVLFAVMREILR